MNHSELAKKLNLYRNHVSVLGAELTENMDRVHEVEKKLIAHKGGSIELTEDEALITQYLVSCMVSGAIIIELETQLNEAKETN